MFFINCNLFAESIDICQSADSALREFESVVGAALCSGESTVTSSGRDISYVEVTAE